MPGPSEPRRLRADAARNRQSLLDAAAAVFAEQGTDVSIAEIAQRAGIGKGTVFRHFPTKERLIAAIVCAQLDELSSAGTALLTLDDATAALHEFMRLGVALQARDRSVCQAALAVVHDAPEMQTAADCLTGVADALAHRAHDQGGIRDGVTGQDVILLLRGAYQAAAPLAETAPDLWHRYLAVIIDGLRPTPGSLPLPSVVGP